MKRLLVAASVLLLATRALAADVDDVVLLRNGGRIRGVVVEEDPTSGVRLKLPDGTIRVIRAVDVTEVRYGGRPSTEAPPPVVPPPPPPVPAGVPVPPVTHRGALHVESATPGMVSVDGADVGPAPADVSGLLPGSHVVAMHFTSGETHEDTVFIQAGKTLRWVLTGPQPSDVKPFQLELGAFLGYGASLSGDNNPYGFGIGARAGLLAYRFYLGVDLTHYAGSSFTESNLPPQTVSATTNMLGVRAGYDIHVKDGFVTFAMRPFVGFERAWENEAIGNDTYGESSWRFAPGLLLSAGIGRLAFAGIESRLSVGGDQDALSFFAMGGLRLF